MSNTIISLKKSSIPSAKPASLEFGELAINYSDGKLYYKNTNSQIAEISGSGGGGTIGDNFSTINANSVLIIADTTNDILTLEQGDNIIITGDAINDKITISANLASATDFANGKFLANSTGTFAGSLTVTDDIITRGDANIIGNLTVQGVDVILEIAAVGTGANAFTTAANNHLKAIIVGSNTAVGAGANAFTTAANNHLKSIIVGSNTAVGAGANSFASATIAGANTAVGAGANSFTTEANNHLKAIIVGSNTAVGAGANSYAASVGTSANSYLLEVISGANTAVGTGANAFTTAANNHLKAIIVGSNTAVGTGANAFTTAANNHLKAIIVGSNTAVGAGANAYSTATFLPLAGGTITGSLVVQGNATFSGSITYANTQTLMIGDNILSLNADLPLAVAPSENAGIEINRGSAANTFLLWNEGVDKWQFTENGSTYYNIATNTSVESAESIGIAAFTTANAALPSSSYTASDILTKIKTVDGSGSGLDADTVDGIQAASFLRSDAADTATGIITLNDDLVFANRTVTDGHIQLYNGTSASGGYAIGIESSTLYNRSGGLFRWYINTLADTGTSDRMELSTSGLTLTGNLVLSGTVDGRDIATDGTKLDGIESGATADQTASEILSALLTVDGVGSGLDADLLDGYAASVGSTSGPANTIVLRNSSGDDYRRYGFASYFNMSHSVTTRSSETVFFSSTDSYIRKNDATGMRASLNVPTRTGGDASGTWGISITGDAGTLDGLDSTSFLRSNASDVFSGGVLQVYNDSAIDITNTGQINGLQVYQPTAGADALITFHVGGDYAFHFGLSGDDNQLSVGGWSMGANKYKVWHAGNDGSGSGLDADLLDGQHGSYYSPLTVAQAAFNAANNHLKVYDVNGNLVFP